MELKNKTILIISPNKWGTMYLSKHHYAIELAKKGNRVYFLNPPDYDINNIKISKTDYNNLSVVSYKPVFPYKIRFHFRALFDILMKYQINRLLKAVNIKPDIVWCFDFNLFSNLKHFKAPVKIYHPVDPVMYNYQIKPAESADYIFSVSHTILANFNHIKVPKFFINHGINEQFTQLAQSITFEEPKKPICVGYFGNLLRPIINQNFITALIKKYPEIQFHFWGPLKPEDSNIGGSKETDVLNFIHFLQSNNNVHLHGTVSKGQLTEELIKYDIDVFILIYKSKKGESDRSNSHKLLEYLSTGKTIVANQFSNYKDTEELIIMPKNNDDEQIPLLFQKVISNLEYYNSPELQRKRVAYALDNTYEKQIERIEKIISEKLEKNTS